MAEVLPAAPKTAANAAAAHAYACAAAALERLSNRGKPLQTKGAPCSRACHGLASALPWRVVLTKIRYSLAGQDTRLSPERPGFESRWRNELLALSGICKLCTVCTLDIYQIKT